MLMSPALSVYSFVEVLLWLGAKYRHLLQLEEECKKEGVAPRGRRKTCSATFACIHLMESLKDGALLLYSICRTLLFAVLQL